MKKMIIKILYFSGVLIIFYFFISSLCLFRSLEECLFLILLFLLGAYLIKKFKIFSFLSDKINFLKKKKSIKPQGLSSASTLKNKVMKKPTLKTNKKISKKLIETKTKKSSEVKKKKISKKS